MPRRPSSDERVTWHEADAADLPFETGSMDRVSCHQGLQIGEDTGSGMTTVCALGDPAELEASLSEAGVEDVVVSEQAQAARHHDVRVAAAGQLDVRSTFNFAHGTSPSG